MMSSEKLLIPSRSCVLTFVILILLLVMMMGTANASLEKLLERQDFTTSSSNPTTPEEEEEPEENLTLTAVPRDGEVELYWSLSENKSEEMEVDYYNITRDEEPIIRLNVSKTSHSYLDERVDNWVEYTYQVEAVGQEINGSERINVTSNRASATPESYWWIWPALTINIVGLGYVVYYFYKNKDKMFFGD